MSLIENVDYIVIKKPVLGLFFGRYQLIRKQVYQSKLRLAFPVDHKYFRINTDGLIVAEIGYEWDGATGGVETKSFMRGSLMHDLCCQSIEEKLLPQTHRKDVDKLLYDILTEDGMSGFRRAYVYHAIRLYVRVAY